jgi:aminopeptidase N
MSTYLVAFVISDFTHINKTSVEDVLIEVAARPEAIENNEGEFALKEAADIIDFFVEYFDTKYPLPKSSNISNSCKYLDLI